MLHILLIVLYGNNLEKPCLSNFSDIEIFLFILYLINIFTCIFIYTDKRPINVYVYINRPYIFYRLLI